MNPTLYLDYLAATRRARCFRGLRTDLSIPHGFASLGGLRNDSSFERQFSEFRQREGFTAPFEVLAVNYARRRIVFSTTNSDGSRIVVKWRDDSAVGCFNFVGSRDAEVAMHSSAVDLGETAIPGLVGVGKDFVVVEHISGVPLLHFMRAGGECALEKAFAALLAKLKPIYESTCGGVFGLVEFNRTVHRDYSYLVSTRGGARLEELVAGYYAPAGAQKLYEVTVQTVCRTFSSIKTPLPTCMTIRDLDEHNVIVDDASGRVYAVDMEDAELGHFVFDLAFLSARIFLAAKPMDVYQRTLPTAFDAIAALEDTSQTELRALYLALASMQLIIAAMNSWLWPAPSSFERDRWSVRRRASWLRGVWSVVEEMLEAAGRSK